MNKCAAARDFNLGVHRRRRATMQAVSTDEDEAQQPHREPAARGGALWRDCNHRRSRHMRAAAVAALLVVLVVNMPSSTADDQPAAPTHHHSKKFACRI